jgi:hypothetical protein
LKRYMQLDRLSKDWRARASIGEIPETLAGDRDGHPVLILLGIAAVPFAFPADIDRASLLPAMQLGQYPGAAVEEFATARGTGAGIRRCEEAALPAPSRSRWRPIVRVAAIWGSTSTTSRPRSSRRTTSPCRRTGKGGSGASRSGKSLQ